ncbi:MAG: cobalamin-binding protein, partial [Longimicrobiales bacterium]
PGHWVPEMIDIAGGANLVGTAGSHSTQTKWAALDGLDPAVLVIMPCGYDLDATKRDAENARERLQAVAPRAIDSRRAYVVNGSAYFNRSGPRFVNGIEILAGLLHPELFEPPPADTAEVWT